MLAHDGARELVLNLRGLRFMDIGGQKQLILLWRQSIAAGCGFRLIGVSDEVRGRLRMTGVDKLLRLA
jgi:anti-anti-sigma factor